MDNKLSTLIRSQFPEFVQEDYPALIRFVELYYEFLEIQKNPQDVLSNLIAYTDIDRTLDEFVSKFEASYIDTLPPQIAGDRRNFIKHIDDLYQTKGTTESYKLLFRLLFDEEIEVYLPRQQMLRVSDGKWNQRNSIKVKVLSGDALQSINKSIKIKTASGVINTYIKDVFKESAVIYELFIDKQFSLPISPGDTVTGLNFSAVCLPTAVSVDVITAGAGFHIGQVFDVSSVGGSGTKVKVTQIDGDGGIKRLAFLSFGSGYVTEFLNTVQPNVRTTGAVEPYKSYTNGFIEQVYITKVTYFSQDYVDLTYSGSLVGSAYSNDYTPDNAGVVVGSPALLKFSIGSLCQYRGEYTSADGFLSDVNVIQDGYQYQDFSYVIKTKRKIQEYANIVKKLIHPAGTIMFGELQAELNIDIENSLAYEKVLSANLKFAETAIPSDTRSFSVGKKLTDAAVPIDTLSKTLIKALTDAATSGDSVITLNTGKPLTDAATSADVINNITTGKALTDASTSDDSGISNTTGKAITDAATSGDSGISNTIGKALIDASTSDDSGISNATGKNLIDAITSGDSGISNATGKAITDAATIVESISKAFSSPEADAVTPSDSSVLNISKALTDSATSTDSTPSIILTNYAVPTYFGQNYVGTVLL